MTRFAFSLFFLAGGLWPMASGLHAQTLGSSNGLIVQGTGGAGADPDDEIKGFTVFGSTQATYAGPVQSGNGNVVVNGQLSVGSGAYFVGRSTFNTGGAYFTGISSFSDVANIYAGGSGAAVGYGLGPAVSGALQWTTLSLSGDNLGNHTATTNLNLNGYWLSGSGGSNGVYVNGSGQVGIGTTPGTALDVGTGSTNIATSLTVAGVTYASVPSGMVSYFTGGSCPTGWTELTDAAGYYLVGLLSGQTSGAAGRVGTALTINESRATGTHTHGILADSHTHSYYARSSYWNTTTYFPASFVVQETSNNGGTRSTNLSTNSGITAINNSINDGDGNSGTAGTNAPYIYLRICYKNG